MSGCFCLRGMKHKVELGRRQGHNHPRIIPSPGVQLAPESQCGAQGHASQDSLTAPEAARLGRTWTGEQSVPLQVSEVDL